MIMNADQSQTRYFAYIRVSTDQQATSLEAQTERIEDYCRQNGVALSGLYRDEHVSGGKRLGDRPAGGELLRTIQPGDTVLVAKLDRIFRKASDGLNVLDQWEDKNITLILVDSFQTVDTSTPMGFNSIAGQLVFAETERRMIVHRVKQTLAHKKAQGRCLTRPDQCQYGYKVEYRREGDTDVAYLADNPAEIAVIAEAVRLRRDGLSLRAIAADLYDQGKTARNGKMFSPQVLSGILNAAG